MTNLLASLDEADKKTLLQRKASAYLALMKPRVMSLAIFTALVGMLAAPATLSPLSASIAIIAISLGAGASGALNMWWDRDIDAIMRRTRNRPLPTGALSATEALTFGLLLAAFSIALLAAAANAAAAALLAFAIFFYVCIYTIWLKRRTPQNIVIGGAAGALPPAIGWASATGGITLEPILFFTLIFVWTPPHFWSLALFKSEDYVRAGVPMLPVVKGAEHTRKAIFLYSCLLFPVALAPAVWGGAGWIFASAAFVSGSIFVYFAWRLWRQEEAAQRTAEAQRLFAYSIFHLFILFAIALIAQTWIRI